ncbi:unnamed protein product, partial [Vitis vinifera]
MASCDAVCNATADAGAAFVVASLVSTQSLSSGESLVTDGTLMSPTTAGSGRGACGGDGGRQVIGSGLLTVAGLRWRRCETVEAAAPPRANMMRQRARYSSSVGWLSKRGRLERLRLAHDSREWRLGLREWYGLIRSGKEGSCVTSVRKGRGRG